MNRKDASEARTRACLVVALWSEARPLVDHFGMEADDAEGPFRLYRGDELCLIVSGVGKTAAAAAVAYLYAHIGKARDQAWINFGIGGHRSLAPGTEVLGHKVVDAASGRTWYPQWALEGEPRSATVVTVDRVEREFADDAVYEMEASGFYATASRVSTAELIQVLKVVSDGRDVSPDGLTARRVRGLVSASLAVVDRLVTDLLALARGHARSRPRVETDPWIRRWRFTVTQRRRLARLLARLRVVDPLFQDPDASLARAAELRDAKAVLERLEEDLRLSAAAGRSE